MRFLPFPHPTSSTSIYDRAPSPSSFSIHLQKSTSSSLGLSERLRCEPSLYSLFQNLCSLSFMSHLRESNSGPQLYESCALPTELRWLGCCGAVNQICTDDLILTMNVLYCLSYNGNVESSYKIWRYYSMANKKSPIKEIRLSNKE